MNVLKFCVCALGFFFLQNSASAQCGCVSQAVPVVVRHMPVQTLPAPVMALPTPRPVGNVAYVNQLAQPIDRGNHTLKYAIHLTDGRILLSDYLPRGQAIRGTEHQSGGRRMTVAIGGNGAVTVKDPANSEVVAVFDK
ncbi:MAG: hypothetical protein SFV81_01760 [Pirellulaceae bacterium]|nr:hypothetical protein [Pirellulaceae bacterium]